MRVFRTRFARYHHSHRRRELLFSSSPPSCQPCCHKLIQEESSFPLRYCLEWVYTTNFVAWSGLQPMSTETPSKGKITIKLVTLDKGLKLAESWVKKMSGSAIDESTEVEFDGRQPRLGLGAKAVHQSRLGGSADPVERRLLASVDAGKRRAARSLEESNPPEKNVGPSEEDHNSDDDPESRTTAFTKKRAISMPPSLQANKKKK